MTMRVVRGGHTLIELVSALTLTGFVLTLAVGAMVRESRSHLALAARGAARAQLQQAGLALAADLRALSPHAGDLPAAEARDSSIELRAHVGTATVCDTARGALAVREVASPDAPAGLPGWSPSAGDSAWLLFAADSAPRWEGRAVAAARRSAAACAGLPGVLLDVTAPPPLGTVPGTPVRVTRHARWSLYRSADGQWYLGFREWSASLGRFDVVQPVAGPLAAYANTGGGLRFRYLDSSGAELPMGAADPRTVARIELVLRAPRLAGRRPRAGELGLSSLDSETVAIALDVTGRAP
jgi:hypothetical protein